MEPSEQPNNPPVPSPEEPTSVAPEPVSVPEPFMPAETPQTPAPTTPDMTSTPTPEPSPSDPMSTPVATPTQPMPKEKAKRHIPLGAMIIAGILLVFVILMVVLAFNKK